MHNCISTGSRLIIIVKPLYPMGLVTAVAFRNQLAPSMHSRVSLLLQHQQVQSIAASLKARRMATVAKPHLDHCRPDLPGVPKTCKRLTVRATVMVFRESTFKGPREDIIGGISTYGWYYASHRVVRSANFVGGVVPMVSTSTAAAHTVPYSTATGI